MAAGALCEVLGGTIQQVEKSLPPSLKSAVTQQLVDQINNITSDPLVAEQIRENFLSYSTVLREGRFKAEDYLNAVAYVSYKLMGMSNQDAWFRTFPQRYQALVAKGTSSKDIAAHVSMYAKGKLVNLITEQTLIPAWVTNHAVFQEAINTQATLMRTAASEKVRCEAANSLLSHLAKPKDAAPVVNIGLTENSGMTELKNTLAKMAQQQQELMNNNVPIKAITAQTIIDVEAKTQ